MVWRATDDALLAVSGSVIVLKFALNTCCNQMEEDVEFAVGKLVACYLNVVRDVAWWVTSLYDFAYFSRHHGRSLSCPIKSPSCPPSKNLKHL